jgi:quercetin dioxygenase-like cupin family protein
MKTANSGFVEVIIMEFISKESIVELCNPGVVSKQLLNPKNSSSIRVTITEVHLEMGASQPRHTHDVSEQIWYATKGTGKLLLANDEEKEFKAGDIVRFADKDIHGLLNNGNEEFVYVSVTAPPINFEYAYRDRK